MRIRSSLVVLPVLVLLAGCAPTPAPSPSPTETMVSPSPTPTETTTPTPTPSPTAGGEFTAAQLVSLCTEQTKSLAPDATYFPDMATTELLTEAPLWFVVVPKTLDGNDTVAVCGISGTPESPVFDVAGESLPSGVADIRDELLAGEHGGES